MDTPHVMFCNLEPTYESYLLVSTFQPRKLIESREMLPKKASQHNAYMFLKFLSPKERYNQHIHKKC